jgi:hypothetical protein
MVMPALPNKALITKGIFGVSVVAITATVGIVSFAQAARPFDNGYNGYGSNAIVAAVHAFQAAVQDAAQAFNSDVNACIGNTQADVSARAAANTFKAQTNTSVHSMSAQFSSPSTLSRDPKVMRNKLNAADTNLNSALTQEHRRPAPMPPLRPHHLPRPHPFGPAGPARRHPQRHSLITNTQA